MAQSRRPLWRWQSQRRPAVSREKGGGTIWLYRFSWWDDVTGAFYPMINPTESDREWDEDVTEIMMLDRILPFEE